MIVRRVPPVHSPLPARALVSGLAAMARAAPYEEALRRRLLQEYEADGVLLTDSGTTALALALRAAAEVPDQPVALPAYCCYDVATAADAAQVPVLLYDLDPQTLSPDLDSLERALGQGAGVVVVAHQYGLPIAWSEVDRLARRYGAPVVEDAAQGQGARYEGKRLGALGVLSLLSFGRGKGITGGRGGALLWRGGFDPDRITPLQPVEGGLGLPVTLTAAAQWLLARPALYAIPASLPFLHLGETRYRRPHEPRGLTAFAAGALSVTWALAEREAAVRGEHAGRLRSALADSPASKMIATVPGATPSYLRLPVLVDGSELRNRLQAVGRRLGVMPGYPKSLGDLNGFAQRVLSGAAACLGARDLSRRLWTFPTHSRLSDRDLRALERAVLETTRFASAMRGAQS